MNSKTSDGYFAIPATGKGRPVLVLHAWWGLNDTIRQFCTRLAEYGFVAFAPDLYQGKVTDTIEGAEELSQSLDEVKGGCEHSSRRSLPQPASCRGVLRDCGDRLLSGSLFCPENIQ